MPFLDKARDGFLRVRVQLSPDFRQMFRFRSENSFHRETFSPEEHGSDCFASVLPDDLRRSLLDRRKRRREELSSRDQFSQEQEGLTPAAALRVDPLCPTRARHLCC